MKNTFSLGAFIVRVAIGHPLLCWITIILSGVLIYFRHIDTMDTVVMVILSILLLFIIFGCMHAIDDCFYTEAGFDGTPGDLKSNSMLFVATVTLAIVAFASTCIVNPFPRLHQGLVYHTINGKNMWAQSLANPFQKKWVVTREYSQGNPWPR